MVAQRLEAAGEKFESGHLVVAPTASETGVVAAADFYGMCAAVDSIAPTV